MSQVTDEVQVWFSAWYSGLRIQHCCSYSIGCSCVSDSIPGPGTSICHGCRKKKNHQSLKLLDQIFRRGPGLSLDQRTCHLLLPPLLSTFSFFFNVSIPDSTAKSLFSDIISIWCECTFSPGPIINNTREQLGKRNVHFTAGDLEIQRNTKMLGREVQTQKGG